jgi:putative transcriptional regulator
MSVNRVKLARVKKDMSQQDLADLAEVTRQTIGLIEAGNYNPSLGLCLKLCWALDAKLDELFWKQKEDENRGKQ